MAQITDEDAIANGWVITYDAFGTKLYQSPEGYVFNADAQDNAQPIANVTRDSTGGSAGFDFWTDVQDLVKQGLSIYQINQQQKAFNEANKVRIAQGQAPLPWTDFSPTASVGVTADPRILWTILGVGVVLALGIFGGGRRGRARGR
jgi:hypothetical protein